MKLSNIRDYGRYINPETNRPVNVKKGRNPQRGTDHLFYLYRQQRQYISDVDFYDNWAKI